MLREDREHRSKPESTLARVSELRGALEASVPDLQRAAREKGHGALVERDFQRALEEATGARSVSVELKRWPQVGPIDIVLTGGIALELKWCKSGDTLGNCAWDVAKLACALVEDKIAEGWIVAGAPAAHWDTNSSGVALFTSRAYVGDEIVRSYESWWRFWCKDVLTRPVDLPNSLTVAGDDAVDIELDGVPYVLRSARVEVIDPTWRPHVCPHRWQGVKCRSRTWDPNGDGGLVPEMP